MEEEMEELCAEGLATHGGPSRASTTREGVARRWTGARAGRAMAPRTGRFGVLPLSKGRKATPPVVLSRGAGGPARSEDQGMCGTFLREGRERPCLPVR